ncbi:MAG: ABC transporter permease [Pseudomonadales bacterium]|nr:ABC transporter permease [Pseudomonadales bacterium]
MSAIGIVFAKEVRDNVRDRRTRLSALGVAGGGPLLFVALMSFILDTVISGIEEPMDLAVVGAEHAPNLIDRLERNDGIIVAGPDDPARAVAEREHDVVLVIPAAFADAWRAGRPAGVRLIYDSTRQTSSERDHRRIAGLLQRFSKETSAQRLQVRGIDSGILRPIAVRSSDVASPAARATTALGMIPYFLVFAVFMGGFYLAIDTTAGERDLGSLEPLLTLPVARDELALGKLAATALFCVLTLILAPCAFALAIRFVPLSELGMTIDFGPLTVLRIIAAVAPLALLASALMMVVASFTKSFKEAQSWLSPTILIPTMPLIIVAFLAPQANAMTMLVPSLSQALLINEAIAGAPFVVEHLLVSAASTLFLGALATAAAVRLYRREALLG